MQSEFKHIDFAPVIELPPGYEVYDFSRGYNAERERSSEYGIGKYNERRPGMYDAKIFSGTPEQVRDIHIGIDIAAPVGTPVTAFYGGTVYLAAINSSVGDYGGTIITEHRIDGRDLWALYGHLSHASVHQARSGTAVSRGGVIGWVGDKNENGGWNPHLHFQLSWKKPERCDLPGVVNERDLEWALATFPDPRLVLGPLY